MRNLKLYPCKFLARGAVALSLFCAPAAHAADDTASTEASASGADSAAKLNEEGAAMFKAHDYRHAAEKFIRAYAIDPDPNLLFNIARCYESMGDSQGAIEKYEEFTRNPGADPQGKARAEERMQSLRNPKPEPVPGESSIARASAESEPLAGEPSAPPPSQKPGSKLGALPWITLGTGIVAAGVGGTFYVMGDKDHSKVTSAKGYGDSAAVDPMTEKEAQSLVDSGSSKKTIGGISIAVGGALIATSVVLFLVDSPKKENADASVAWGVLPSKGGGTVSLQGSF